MGFQRIVLDLFPGSGGDGDSDKAAISVGSAGSAGNAGNAGSAVVVAATRATTGSSGSSGSSSSSSSSSSEADDEAADLRGCLVAKSRARGLEPVPSFIGKCVQLYETIRVRHGVMLVGHSNSGKTENYRVLSDALGEVELEDAAAAAAFGSQASVLAPGVDRHGTVAAEATEAFKIKIGPGQGLKVVLQNLIGDADLFVSCTNDSPNEDDHTWKSESEGNDVVEVVPADPNYVDAGTYFVGVFGAGEKVDFCLTATLLLPPFKNVAPAPAPAPAPAAAAAAAAAAEVGEGQGGGESGGGTAAASSFLSFFLSFFLFFFLSF